MDHPILQIVMRYIHVVSAIVFVGGMSFALLCFLPIIKSLDGDTGSSLRDRVQARFLKVTWWAIAGLVVSGTYTWILLAPAYKQAGKAANALIGIKVFIALIIFAIVFAQAIGLIKPASPKRVLMINIHLAAVVILLAAILRYLHLPIPAAS